MNLAFYLDRPFGRNSLSLAVVREDVSGLRFFAKPLEFEAVPIEEAVSTDAVVPITRLRLAQGQQLMDELWRVGLRPAEGSGSAGSLAATERHLKDMQRIAFMLMEPRHVLKVEGPGIDPSEFLRPGTMVPR